MSTRPCELLKILVGAKQEGEDRGYKINILASSQFSPHFDLFISTPFLYPLDQGAVLFSECLPDAVLLTWLLIY